MSEFCFNIGISILFCLGAGSLITILVIAYVQGGKITDAEIRALETKAGVRHRKFY